MTAPSPALLAKVADFIERNDPFGDHFSRHEIAQMRGEPLFPTRGLSDAELKAQGARCGCLGADDYCPCQNVPDGETMRAWLADATPSTART